VIRRLAALAAALVLVAGCGGDSRRAAAATSPGSRIVVVMMENKEQGDVIDSPDAPYVNSLARRYAAPRRFYGIRHPSLPNYLALLGGSTYGVTSNCTGCIQGGRTLVDQLEKAGVSWRAYMEGMPRACFTGAGSGRYAKKHNPFVYFRRIVNRPKRCAKVVPATRLEADTDAGRLPQFVFITPDLCNDTHDCSVAHGDRYLSNLIPPLLRQLGPEGFLVLAWEEGDSDAGCCGGLARGGRVPVVIAGPNVRQGARPRTAWSHYSTLRTVEDAFGLPHLRNAGAAAVRPLDAAFEQPPRLR
jgi:phospholipase C